MKVKVDTERDEVTITMSLEQADKLDEACSEYIASTGRLVPMMMMRDLNGALRRAMRQVMFGNGLVESVEVEVKVTHKEESHE